MLCVRCKKRPAIVFVQKLEAGVGKKRGLLPFVCGSLASSPWMIL